MQGCPIINRWQAYNTEVGAKFWVNVFFLLFLFCISFCAIKDPLRRILKVYVRNREAPGNLD